MITPYNLLRHELVGLGARVVASSHRGYVGLSGTIVDESRDTLRVEAEGGVKAIPKKDVVVEFTLPGDAVVEVEGGLLSGRPEDRIKKKIRIKFA